MRECLPEDGRRDEGPVAGNGVCSDPKGNAVKAKSWKHHIEGYRTQCFPNFLINNPLFTGMDVLRLGCNGKGFSSCGLSTLWSLIEQDLRKKSNKQKRESMQTQHQTHFICVVHSRNENKQHLDGGLKCI